MALVFAFRRLEGFHLDASFGGRLIAAAADAHKLLIRLDCVLLDELGNVFGFAIGFNLLLVFR